MPAENLRRLIERTAPGRSVRQLEEAAGAAPQTVGYWLKPGTKVSRVPSAQRLQEIARIIGASTQDTYCAFRADAGVDLDLADDLPEDERGLLRDYRRLSENDQRKLRAILVIFRDGS